MKKRIQWMMAAILFSSLSLTSCVDSSDNPVSPGEKEQGQKQEQKLPFIHAAWMDPSVNPGDNFYMYVFGTWDKTHAQDDNGYVFNIARKYSDMLYNDFMNSSDPLAQHLVKNIKAPATTFEEDVKSVLDYLKIQKPTSIGTSLQEIGKLQDKGLNPFFAKLVEGHEETHAFLEMVFIGDLLTDSKRAIQQNTKDTYLNTIMNVLGSIDVIAEPEKIKSNPDEYLIGLAARAKKILAFEEYLYGCYSQDEAASSLQLEGSGIHGKDPGMVSMPQYIEAKDIARPSGTRADAVKDEVSLETLKTAFNLGEHSILNNSDAFKSYIKDVEGFLKEEDGLTFGYDYMRYYAVMKASDFFKAYYKNSTETVINREMFRMFSSIAPLMMNRLTHDTMQRIGQNQVEVCTASLEELRTVFQKRLEKLDWLSDATRQAALDKLKAMKFNVGVPDRFIDGEFTLDEKNTLVEDALSLMQQNMANKQKSLLGKKVEDFPMASVQYNRWYGALNAFYSPGNNALVIFPIYISEEMYPKNDVYVRQMANFVFGHEMTHGFDANGATYDARGYKKNWWTPADAAKFKEKQDKMITLYNRLEAFPGQTANGRFTLTENMADYGGVTLAYELFKQQKEKDGLSGEALDLACQEFFLHYAMHWQGSYSLEHLKDAYYNDDHSSGINRVNGVVTLFDDWYRLFNVKSGKIYVAPENRVKIW
jgi:predicted metalloendopeptidase